MPLTVTASNSISYWLWQLPATHYDCEDITEYHGIDVPLTDGYKSSLQVGFDAGIKSWKLTFTGISSATVRSDGITANVGGTVSREVYLRSIYNHNKTFAKPFVFEWRGVYYFVDFADEALSMQRMKVKIYTTGITLVQRRLKGVTLPAVP